MSFTTYADFKDVIASRLKRVDASNYVDDFVLEAEAYFNRTLRLNAQLQIDASFAVTSRYTALPTGFLELRRALASLSGKRRELLPLGSENEGSTDDGSTPGDPVYYTIMGTNIELIPAPSAALTLELAYYKKLDTITTEPATLNKLFTEHPDIYLYRTLIQGSIHYRDTRRTNDYSEMYADMVRTLARSERRARQGTGMFVRRG